MLNAGEIPIYEPGLEPMVRRNVGGGRLRFTTDVDASVAHGAAAVHRGRHAARRGRLGRPAVRARRGAQHRPRACTGRKIIVDKSTVPVGTADQVRAAIAEELAARGGTLRFAVVSNPEFLKEGAAVEDFMRPDRIVIGADDERRDRRAARRSTRRSSATTSASS